MSTTLESGCSRRVIPPVVVVLLGVMSPEPPLVVFSAPDV